MQSRAGPSRYIEWFVIGVYVWNQTWGKADRSFSEADWSDTTSWSGLSANIQPAGGFASAGRLHLLSVQDSGAEATNCLLQSVTWTSCTVGANDGLGCDGAFTYSWHPGSFSMFLDAYMEDSSWLNRQSGGNTTKGTPDCSKDTLKSLTRIRWAECFCV